ncbi:MAG: prolipoprotein diacylglyceryl transferase [Pseudobdellovibrionaceae bacterium]
MHFHETGPYLFRISDNLGVQWNGLSFMLSLVVSFVFMSWMSYRQRSELGQARVGSFLMSCVAGALLGGRLGFCLFYAPSLFLKFRAEFPFWGVLALDEGGLSAFGSIVGVVVAATIFAIRTGVSRIYLYDLVAICAPISIFFSRVANFLTGEFIGREAPADLTISVKFPTEIFHWPALQPQKLQQLTPLVEKVGTDAEKWQTLLLQSSGQEEARASISQILFKVVESVQSGSQDMRGLLEPLLTARHPVQLYEAALEGFCLFVFLFFLWRKPRSPGILSATFLVFYSAIRIFVDQYRMPDPVLGFDLFHLLRGQWLAIATLVIGLVLLFIWGRRETLLSPGWGRGHSVKLHRR